MPRKQHAFHYIYKTTCSVTGRFYVGMHSTSNLEDDYIGSGKRLWLSIREHGRENHTKEILEFLETRDELKRREKEIVNENFIADPMCMNIQPGGIGGVSEEMWKKWVAKASQKHLEKLKNDPLYRKSYGEKISASKRGKPGKPHTEEYRCYMSWLS